MSKEKENQKNEMPSLDGIAGLIQNIAFIQTRIEDFIDEDGEAIEITDQQKFVKRKIAEYLGIEIPPEKLVINAKGCIAMAKPKCPNCGSLEIWENGTRKRKPQTITGTKIEIKIQKYQCAQCKKNFEPDITRYIQAYQRFTAEIQAFAVCLYNKGVSAEEIVEILYTMYNVTVTATTIRSWVKKLSGEIVVVENEEGLSDIFHFDEQRVMLDGKEHWRYTIIDTNGNVVCDRIEEQRDQSTIERVLVEELGGREVSYIVTDLDRKYDGAIENLRRENVKKLKHQVRIRHQLCVFHQIINIRKVLEEIYGRKGGRGLNEFGKGVLKEIAGIFRSGNRDEAWRKLESLYQREDIPWRLRKELEKMADRFEDLTWYLVDERVPMTNNRVELYYRITQPERVKKRFKNKASLDGVLKFFAKKRKESVNFLVIAGLTITIWQALGFLAEIIR